MLRGHMGVVGESLDLSEDLAFVTFVLGTTAWMLEVNRGSSPNFDERWLLAENESGRSLLFNLAIAPAGIAVVPINSSATEFVESLLSSEGSTELGFVKHVRKGASAGSASHTSYTRETVRYDGAASPKEFVKLVLGA